MGKLEKVADVRANVAPTVDNVSCCNCLSKPKNAKVDTGLCKNARCNCCTKEYILERAVMKPARTFGRWISN